MIIHDVIQGTPEWNALKCGKFTSSEIEKLLMGKSTKGYNDYIDQIVFERLTGKKVEKYSNKDMERGIELEPFAREDYELRNFVKVEQVGFIERDEWTGCSPDGLIGDDGMIQIKCPKWSTQMQYLYKHVDPSKEYFIQLQSEMLFSGRQWNEIYCYHPDLDPVSIRVEPDLQTMQTIEKEIELAKIEVEKRLTKLRGKNEKTRRFYKYITRNCWGIINGDWVAYEGR